MKIRKILCCCISGLGSSFIVEMNLKKVLSKLKMEEVEVAHAGISDAFPGAADLFICSSDVYEECLKAGETIALDRLTDINELESKLSAYMESHS
jgi:PTS system ascorbate-specific IIB component